MTALKREGRAARLVARLGVGEPNALILLRPLPHLRRASDAVLREAAPGLALADGLALLAAEFGFATGRRAVASSPRPTRSLISVISWRSCATIAASIAGSRGMRMRWRPAARSNPIRSPTGGNSSSAIVSTSARSAWTWTTPAGPRSVSIGSARTMARRVRLYARLIAAHRADEVPRTARDRLRVRPIAAWHAESRCSVVGGP